MGLQIMALDTKNRKLHLEVLRILAIMLVLFHHTEGRGFILFLQRDGFSRSIYLLLSILCEIAVPIFFMISGALLLKKEESIKDILCKRVLRFIIVLFAITVIYRFYDLLVNDKPTGGFMGIVNAFVNNAASGALWYMYSYICLLFMLPFLRSIAKNATKEHYIYLIVLNLFFVGILPILSFALSGGKYYYSNTFNIVLATTMSFFFFLIGHFFENVVDESFYSLKNCLWLSLAAFATLVICAVMTEKWIPLRGFADSTSKGFHYTLVAVPTVAVYAWTKYLFGHTVRRQKLAAVVTHFGQCTFGIFLFERILRQQTLFMFNWLDGFLPVILACGLWIIAIVLIGTAFISLLKLIPGVKKYI